MLALPNAFDRFMFDILGETELPFRNRHKTLSHTKADCGFRAVGGQCEATLKATAWLQLQMSGAPRKSS